jgi:hypothetical protein
MIPENDVPSELYAIVVGELLHGVREGQALLLHHEVEDITAGLTTEAMVHALLFIDPKAWGGVLVEGTPPRVLMLLDPGEGKVRLDDVHDGQGLLNVRE